MHWQTSRIPNKANITKAKSRLKEKQQAKKMGRRCNHYNFQLVKLQRKMKKKKKEENAERSELYIIPLIPCTVQTKKVLRTAKKN